LGFIKFNPAHNKLKSSYKIPIFSHELNEYYLQNNLQRDRALESSLVLGIKEIIKLGLQKNLLGDFATRPSM